MARVWVPQEVPFDLTKAERFGEVRFVTAKDFYRIKNSEHNRELVNVIADAIREFDPREDWLLFAGSPYVFGLMCLAVGARWKGQLSTVRFLRWSPQERDYFPLELEL